MEVLNIGNYFSTLKEENNVSSRRCFMTFQDIARIVYVLTGIFFTERAVHVVQIAWDTKDIPTVTSVVFVYMAVLYIFVRAQYINQTTKRDNIYPL